jgi:hypothetical protein
MKIAKSNFLIFQKANLFYMEKLDNKNKLKFKNQKRVLFYRRLLLSV